MSKKTLTNPADILAALNAETDKALAKGKVARKNKPKPVIRSTVSKRHGRPLKPGNLPPTVDLKIPAPKKIVDQNGKPPPTNGNVESLHELIRFTLHCRVCNMSLLEIQEQIVEQFKMEPPAISTISSWIMRYHEAADEDCKDFRNRQRHQQDLIIEGLLKRWLPVAAAEKLHVLRMRMEDGEMQPVMDENAYDEQAKASAIVIKLLERKTKLWNLDLTPDNKNVGNVTPDTISLYIIQQLQGKLQHGGAIDVDSSVQREGLELTSGDGDIDSL